MWNRITIFIITRILKKTPKTSAASASAIETK